MPKVSVIVPVYNAERYLVECLDSVLGQTLRDIEVICVDDGSTDRSPSVLSDYAARDSRIRLLSTSRAGAGAARNRGLAEARGEYVFFCDADDWIDRDALCSMYSAASSARADVAMTGIRYFDSDTGREFRVWRIGGGAPPLPQPFAPSDIGLDLFPVLRPQTGGKMFRREFVESTGNAFQEQPRVNDLAFVATAIALAERIVADGEARYHYRKNQGGTLSSGINARPEMSTLAWMCVKERLVAKGVFGKFEAAFTRGASKSMSDSLLAITDAQVAEAFFRRLRTEFIPALGLRADGVVDAAKPLFRDDATPLEMFMKRLDQEKAAHHKTRAQLVLARAESGCRACRFFRRLFGLSKSTRGGAHG